MAELVDDLAGLNVTPMRDQPFLVDPAHARRLVAGSAGLSLGVAGARHTQGGHCFVRDGRLLHTMGGLNAIGQPRPVEGHSHLALLHVEAGATWEEIQRVVGPYGYAPMVQQSSPFFSVGGSLGANCHGRDPRCGPLSCSVEDLTVLTGTGELLTASRTVESELFNAVIGGYGACGMVLSATLRLVANSKLEYVGDWKRREVDDYVHHLRDLASHPEVQLHYAWLNCVPGRFYEECLVADLKSQTAPDQLVPQTVFKEDEWGEGEILRAGWSAARRDMRARRLVWEELCDLHLVNKDGRAGGKGHAAHRIDWLRASVSFTARRSPAAADILQEYFVPLDALPGMLGELRTIFQKASASLNVLSTTLRIVRRERDDVVLSYCRGGDRVCIAVDAEAATTGSGEGRELDEEARGAIQAATDAALAHGGSWYLPYARVAGRAQMRAAYGTDRVERLQAAIDRWNPAGAAGPHRFWNRFLGHYFD